MEQVKTITNYDLLTEDELIELVEQEQKEMMDNLDTALKALHNRCVNVYYAGDVMFEQYYDNFDYSYMVNCKGAMLLDLKDTENEEKSSITVREDSIINVEIDDNSKELEMGLMSEYEVENIYIEMQDTTKIRLELQW